MKVSTLLESLKAHIVSVRYGQKVITASRLYPAARFDFLNQTISGISLHSQRSKKGDIFFCLSGTQHEGSDFIAEACRRGAAAAVVDRFHSRSISVAAGKHSIIVVDDARKCLGDALNVFHKFPLEKINLTAVTGTNGKTTITYLLENIVKTSGDASGVIGTVNYRLGKKTADAPTTTPDAVTIFDFMEAMLKRKARFLFMEVSSHALAQNRISGLAFDQAVFTNLTQDHFDYHRTKQRYFEAKALLFQRYLKDGATAVINADDGYGKKLIAILKKNKKVKLLSYGISAGAGVRAKNISLDLRGSSAMIESPKKRFMIETNLIGKYNIYNILAAIGVCLVIGIDIDSIVKGVRNVAVPGRLQRVGLRSGKSIFIDYAHTPDALGNVLSSLRALKAGGRLISVFGCGGDRDRTKRAPMGEIASRLSDYVILTSDNPRSENPQAIITDIKRGTEKNNYCCVIDRKEAIKKAIAMAGNSDIIVVAGKGHEDYQIIKDKRVLFSDKRVIEEILAQKDLSQ